VLYVVLGSCPVDTLQDVRQQTVWNSRSVQAQMRSAAMVFFYQPAHRSCELQTTHTIFQLPATAPNLLRLLAMPAACIWLLVLYLSTAAALAVPRTLDPESCFPSLSRTHLLEVGLTAAAAIVCAPPALAATSTSLQTTSKPAVTARAFIEVRTLMLNAKHDNILCMSGDISSHTAADWLRCALWNL
jgi:hypothetical protein